MEPHILHNVIDTLFPIADGEEAFNWGLDEKRSPEWSEDMEVSEEEIAIRKI